MRIQNPINFDLAYNTINNIQKNNPKKKRILNSPDSTRPYGPHLTSRTLSTPTHTPKIIKSSSCPYHAARLLLTQLTHYSTNI